MKDEQLKAGENAVIGEESAEAEATVISEAAETPSERQTAEEKPKTYIRIAVARKKA